MTANATADKQVTPAEVANLLDQIHEYGGEDRHDIEAWDQQQLDEVFDWAMRIWLDLLDRGHFLRLKNRPSVMGDI